MQSALPAGGKAYNCRQCEHDKLYYLHSTWKHVTCMDLRTVNIVYMVLDQGGFCLLHHQCLWGWRLNPLALPCREKVKFQ